MTDSPLIVVSDPPAVIVAGSGEDFGMITMSTLHEVNALAVGASKLAESDDIDSLRAAVDKLSDAVNLLTGELMNVALGVKHGRIAFAQDRG